MPGSISPLRLVANDSVVNSTDATLPFLDWSWREADPPTAHSSEMLTRVSEAMLLLSKTLAAGDFHSAIIGTAAVSVPPAGRLPAPEMLRGDITAERTDSAPAPSTTPESTSRTGSENEYDSTPAPSPVTGVDYVVDLGEHVVVSKEHGVRVSLVFSCANCEEPEASAQEIVNELAKELSAMSEGERRANAVAVTKSVLEKAKSGELGDGSIRWNVGSDPMIASESSRPPRPSPRGPGYSISGVAGGPGIGASSRALELGITSGDVDEEDGSTDGSDGPSAAATMRVIGDAKFTFEEEGGKSDDSVANEAGGGT